MASNKLKNILRKLPPSYRYYGNSDATVSKIQNGQMQRLSRFCIAEHEDIWHNEQLNVETILVFCFLYIIGAMPKRGLIIALLEVSVGKKTNYFVKKNAKLMYKWRRHYIKIFSSHWSYN